MLSTFLEKNSSFVKNLNRKKGPLAPKNLHMSPVKSMYYKDALRVLASVVKEEKYTKEEFTDLLKKLGYAFTSKKGDSKGSARDYLKVLHGFVDGCMKTSLTASSGVDTSELNMVRLHVAPPHNDSEYPQSLFRQVDKFEQKSGNTGHKRMLHSVPFVLAAQMARMERLLDSQ